MTKDECHVALADDLLEDAVALIGQFELLPSSGEASVDASLVDSMQRICRVAVSKIRQAQHELEAMNEVAAQEPALA